MLKQLPNSKKSNYLFIFSIIIITLIKKTIQGTPPHSSTTLKDIEVSQLKLALRESPSVNGVVSQKVNLNYKNTYSEMPSVALSFGYIDGNVKSNIIMLDLQQHQISKSLVTIIVKQTEKFLNVIVINYIVVSPSSLIKILNTFLDLSLTNVWDGNQDQTRVYYANMNFRPKFSANYDNTICFTSGIYMQASSDSFRYLIAPVDLSDGNYNVQINIWPSSKIKWIRISTVYYENFDTLHVDSPFYLQIMFAELSNGHEWHIKNHQGIEVSSVGTIFSGIAGLDFKYSNTIFDYSVSQTEMVLTYFSNSIDQVTIGYFWYRQLTCPQKKYLNSITCDECHYSCLTCSDASQTSCIQCSSTTRTFDNTNNSCPCNTGYSDIGMAGCQITCGYACQTCAAINVCGTCNPNFNRVLVQGKCDCNAKFFDDGINPVCQACEYYCHECSQLSQCTSCNPAMHRVLNNATKKCECLDGFVDNPSNQECTVLSNNQSVEIKPFCFQGEKWNQIEAKCQQIQLRANPPGQFLSSQQGIITIVVIIIGLVAIFIISGILIKKVLLTRKKPRISPNQHQQGSQQKRNNQSMQAIDFYQ